MKCLISFILGCVCCSALTAQPRSCENFDKDWEFAYGHAGDPARDFGCGTEYFNYLTKAASIHNEGPYSLKFDKARWGVEWKAVDLPYDWVVDLPFEQGASHSHGYKTVGWKYPETSVGWYRKVFTLPATDSGKHIAIRFDGIFRNANIWVNGFWLGTEPSGYAAQVYDLTEYLNFDGENVVAVRADATLEEGWFYEGAGIYRHVWLEKTAPVHVAPFGTFVHSVFVDDDATATVEATVRNDGFSEASFALRHSLLDAAGRCVAAVSVPEAKVSGKGETASSTQISVPSVHRWSLEDPYLYTVRTEVLQGGAVVDTYCTHTGFRDIRFTADEGFFLNGKRVEIKGVNQHQDHPGVGSAIPDALQVYRLKELMKLGVNAIRTSHNPATPELLDACDSLGILVLEENRLTGVNEEHRRLLKRMVERDRNHPSIILWSVGNEEWGIEWTEKGRQIAAAMQAFCHLLDPTRPVTVATSSGPNIVERVDVAGYNYLVQNKIDELHARYPLRRALGTEETSGCGTRGVYYDDQPGRMQALNRRSDTRDSLYNVIGRGWTYYAERPWLAGLFYWTGFDYRGESNPLVFPATGSSFGILDYCGFPKDEAWYLRAWWTEEPVLHIFPHWNLAGHEGEPVSVWVYSNCDQVELVVNGRRLGRKSMPYGGYLSWDTVYKPGSVKAIGYKNGRRVLTEVVETTLPASQVEVLPVFEQDGLVVCTVRLLDAKGRWVPDACVPLDLTVTGPLRILGVGNGDSAWQAPERPIDPATRTFTVFSFNGLAQVLLQGPSGTLTVSGQDLRPATLAR